MFYQSEEVSTKKEEDKRIQRRRDLPGNSEACPQDESFATGLESNSPKWSRSESSRKALSAKNENCELFRRFDYVENCIKG